jgi:hypothetical protein
MFQFHFVLLPSSRNTPSNPLAPYDGLTIVPDCDLPNGIIPCVSLNNDNLPPFGNVDNPSKPCCNPRVPVNVHIAKGWGYDVDQETTPTTGELVVFQNTKMADAVFAGRAADIASFNAKIAEYDAEVFSGGALLRWLRPDGNGGDYEPRKLVGQSCGSPEYSSKPGAECILGNCNLFSKVCGV